MLGNKLNMKKKGFTLAEVLITIAIVGVVAAMTLPVLTRPMREKVIVNKVNKTYAMLSSALKLAIAENGEVDTWGIGNEVWRKNFINIYKKYFKYAKDCGGKGNCIYGGRYSFYSNGKIVAYQIYNDNSSFYQIKLLDGGVIWVLPNESTTCENSKGGIQNVCALIWYDHNGKNLPNIIGNDVFYYFVLKDSIIPYGGLGIADNCKNKKNGYACAAYVYKYKNLDYLH